MARSNIGKLDHEIVNGKILLTLCRKLLNLMFSLWQNRNATDLPPPLLGLAGENKEAFAVEPKTIGRKALEIVAELDNDPEIARATLNLANRTYDAYRGEQHILRKTVVGLAVALSTLGVWEVWENAHTDKVIGFENALAEQVPSFKSCQRQWTPFKAPNCI